MTAQPVVSEEIRPDLSLQLAQTEQRTPEAPAHQAGSFLVAETMNQQKAMRLLSMSLDSGWKFSFAPKPSYDAYLQMDKRFITQRGIPQLLSVYEDMKDQTMPRYLAAAGSAAAEASLMATHFPIQRRLELLEGAVECWTEGLLNSRKIAENIGGQLTEHSQPMRFAFRIATAPLLESVIRGEVTESVLRKVFEDCLELAGHNDVLRREARRRGDVVGAADYYGLGNEINVLLAINRKLSPGRFAVWSFNRSDTGYYLRDQTHDLSVIHQNWGRIRSVTPVEVKKRANRKDRERYDALIIDNHDLSRNQLSQREVLQVIQAAHQDPANVEANHVSEVMTSQMLDMIKKYCEARELRTYTGNSVTKFCDARSITSHHPGFMSKTLSNIRLLLQS